jgi:hypothetical protein
MVVVLGYWLERQGKEKSVRPYITPLTVRIIRDRKWMVAIMVTMLSSSIFLIYQNPQWVTVNTVRGEVPPIAEFYPRIIDGGIGFQGYKLNTTQAQANDTIILTTYWVANPDRPNLPDYQIKIILTRQSDGVISYEKSYRHISSWPTNQWPLQDYIVAVYTLFLPDNLAAGEYQIALEVGSCDRIDLVPCGDALPRTVTDLRNASKQIVLPQLISVSEES